MSHRPTAAARQRISCRAVPDATRARSSNFTNRLSASSTSMTLRTSEKITAVVYCTLSRNRRITAAISTQCVSKAKWPVSKNWTSALGISRLNASAPAGRKKDRSCPKPPRMAARACGNRPGIQGREQRYSYNRRTDRAELRLLPGVPDRSYQANIHPVRSQRCRKHPGYIAKPSFQGRGRASEPSGLPPTGPASRRGSGSSPRSGPQHTHFRFGR